MRTAPFTLIIGVNGAVPIVSIAVLIVSILKRSGSVSKALPHYIDGVFT